MYINVGYEILQNEFMGQKIIVIVILVLLQHDLQRPFNIICADVLYTVYYLNIPFLYIMFLSGLLFYVYFYC